MVLNQGEVLRIEGVRGMSNIKRKFKRINKGNIKSPWVKSVFKDGLVVTEIFYDGYSARTEGGFIHNSKSDLLLLDKAIMKAFKDKPWGGIDDLLNIADEVTLFTLATVEDLWPGT
ncbi:hypothetical protein ES703_23750 [subsurface metagenome]